MKKQTIYRWIFYIAGMVLLALGLTLNTKSELGVSPIISVSYCVANIWDFNFGNVTFVQYCIFVLVELVIHLARKKKCSLLITDILQLPLSLIFTRFMNVFASHIPSLATDCAGTWAASIPARLLLLLIAIVLTGIGAAMSLNMRIVPNPGDGIVQALSDCTGKPVGFAKNCFDAFNVILTTMIGFIAAGRWVGIGIGTLLAVLGVGRVIALFQHIFQKKILELSGIA